MGSFKSGKYIPDSEDFKEELKNNPMFGSIFGHSHKVSDEVIVEKLNQVIKEVNRIEQWIEKHGGV